MDKIECLFDANSLIKYYVNLPGANVVRYLVDKSPNININITNVQVAELISVFYKMHRENIITSEEELEQYKDTFFNDIKKGLFNCYDYVTDHLLDFEVFETISSTKPAQKKSIKSFYTCLWGICGSFKGSCRYQ